MLDKNEIIQGLQNNEFLVKNAMYEYICNLHLYDDEEINEAIIEYIQKNYRIINFTELVHSKLNSKIIECLIEIYQKEKEFKYREYIEEVLIEHYSLIKDLNYNFEELFTNKNYQLLYKKIKHFAKKDPKELIEKYIKSIKEYDNSEEEDHNAYIQEKLITAMGTALIQSEEGYRLLVGNAISLHENMEENDSDFMNEEMTWLVYPLCQAKRPECFWLIFHLYVTNMDYIAYKDNCDYYFSSICNDDFLEYYTDALKQFEKEYAEDYYYDIAEYLNSKEIDDFLLKTLKSHVSQEIKENIIRVLACKFDKRVIPFAIQFVQKGKFVDEEDLKMALTPMLIINKCEDATSKAIINYTKKVVSEENLFKEEFSKKLIKKLQDFLYKDNEQIKEYKRIRKIFEKIVQDMMDYFYEGKFKWVIDYDKNKIDRDKAKEINTLFDNTTQEGIQALSNVLIFKNACNMNSITEEYISKNKYKTEEKIEMLQSMLKSEAGLFEVTNTNLKEGTANLKNVLNGNEYKVTDIGISNNMNNELFYIYTRIITYKNISFCSGLNIPYLKSENFIKKWINEKMNANNQEPEITRFLELYNEYQKDDHGVISEVRYV